MNTMLSQLQPDEPAGKLFTALYLQQLPMAIREQVAAKRFTYLQQLAEFADTLWEAHTAPPITTAVLLVLGIPERPEPACGNGCSSHSSSWPRSDSHSPRHRYSLGSTPGCSHRHPAGLYLLLPRAVWNSGLQLEAAQCLAGKLWGWRWQLTS